MIGADRIVCRQQGCLLTSSSNDYNMYAAVTMMCMHYLLAWLLGTYTVESAASSEKALRERLSSLAGLRFSYSTYGLA